MYRLIFQNRRAALLFVTLMILSTVQLVGTRAESGALAHVERQVAQQRDDLGQAIDELGEDPQVSSNNGFAEEEELRDFADGTEPEPPDGELDTAEGEEPEVMLATPEFPEEQDE